MTLFRARGVKPSDSIHTLNNGLRNLMIIREHWSSQKRGATPGGGAGPRYFGTAGYLRPGTASLGR